MVAEAKTYTCPNDACGRTWTQTPADVVTCPTCSTRVPDVVSPTTLTMETDGNANGAQH